MTITLKKLSKYREHLEKVASIGKDQYYILRKVSHHMGWCWCPYLCLCYRNCIGLCALGLGGIWWKQGLEVEYLMQIS